jgi:TATA-box binding protein (TBP) (component of TFIID and TFIIIB)
MFEFERSRGFRISWTQCKIITLIVGLIIFFGGNDNTERCSRPQPVITLEYTVNNADISCDSTNQCYKSIQGAVNAMNMELKNLSGFSAIYATIKVTPTQFAYQEAPISIDNPWPDPEPGIVYYTITSTSDWNKNEYKPIQASISIVFGSGTSLVFEMSKLSITGAISAGSQAQSSPNSEFMVKDCQIYSRDVVAVNVANIASVYVQSNNISAQTSSRQLSSDATSPEIRRAIEIRAARNYIVSGNDIVDAKHSAIAVFDSGADSEHSIATNTISVIAANEPAQAIGIAIVNSVGNTSGNTITLIQSENTLMTGILYDRAQYGSSSDSDHITTVPSDPGADVYAVYAQNWSQITPQQVQDVSLNDTDVALVMNEDTEFQVTPTTEYLVGSPWSDSISDLAPHASGKILAVGYTHISATQTAALVAILDGENPPRVSKYPHPNSDQGFSLAAGSVISLSSNRVILGGYLSLGGAEKSFLMLIDPDTQQQLDFQAFSTANDGWGTDPSTGKENRIKAGLVDRNNRFVFVGTNMKDDDVASLYFIKGSIKDDKFDQISSKFISDSGCPYANAIIQARDGSYVIAGATSYDSTKEDSKACLVQLSSEGELKKQIIADEKSAANALVQDHKRNFVATGIKSGNVGFFKFDQDLNIISTIATFPEPTNGINAGNAIALDRDDGFIITGVTNYLENDDSADLWLIKTDSTGKRLWDRTFRGPQNDNDFGHSVLSLSDGSYLVGGEMSNNGQADGWIIKTFGDL